MGRAVILDWLCFTVSNYNESMYLKLQLLNSTPHIPRISNTNISIYIYQYNLAISVLDTQVQQYNILVYNSTTPHYLLGSPMITQHILIQ